MSDTLLHPLSKILDELDFEESTDEVDKCEVVRVDCQNIPTWAFHMSSPCPHDGSVVRVCEFHKKFNEDMWNKRLAIGWRMMCLRCGTALISWRWERIR